MQKLTIYYSLNSITSVNMIIYILKLAEVHSILSSVEMQHTVEPREQTHIVDSKHFHAVIELRN